MESISIKAISEEEYLQGEFTVPFVYANKRVPQISDLENDTKKVSITGQLVKNEDDSIIEYGILIGKENADGLMPDDDFVVENVGSHDEYSVLKASSNTTVGANQFVVSFTTSKKGTYKYRAYIVFKQGNETIASYGDVHSVVVS